MEKIKLMADYNCFPLWEISCLEVGNIDPNSLAISQELKDKLFSWADKYDNTLNLDSPAESGFSSDFISKDFIESGRLLAQELQKELGSDYEVIFQS